MPLIIAVLVIVVVICNLKDSSKRADRASALHANTRRKTCAYMEQQLVSKYLLCGMSFDEAFRKSYQDMVDAGFEPCIPKDAYVGARENLISSKLARPFYEYDSLWVRDIYKAKRDKQRSKYKKKHPIIQDQVYFDPMDIYKEIHENFPTCDYEFIKAMDRVRIEVNAKPIGTFLIYPGYGTCEVLNYRYNYDKTKGWYVLRVLKTNKVVDDVKIGDPRISYQGSNIL